MHFESRLDTYADAVKEAIRIRPELQQHGLFAKIEKSPYRGYRLRVIPIGLAIEMDMMHFTSRMFNPREPL